MVSIPFQLFLLLMYMFAMSCMVDHIYYSIKLVIFGYFKYGFVFSIGLQWNWSMDVCLTFITSMV